MHFITSICIVCLHMAQAARAKCFFLNFFILITCGFCVLNFSLCKRYTILFLFGCIGRAAAQPQLRKRPGEEDFLNPIMIDKITTESVLYKSHNVEAPSTPLWNSKAMVESVAEVCRDIAWGEKREIGRIGLALQDHICKDLIEEMVKDMGSYTCVYSLPLEACKRRLRF